MTFGYLCSIFAILGRVHPNKFVNSTLVPLFSRIILKAEPLTRISLIKKE